MQETERSGQCFHRSELPLLEIRFFSRASIVRFDIYSKFHFEVTLRITQGRKSQDQHRTPSSTISFGGIRSVPRTWNLAPVLSRAVMKKNSLLVSTSQNIKGV